MSINELIDKLVDKEFYWVLGKDDLKFRDYEINKRHKENAIIKDNKNNEYKVISEERDSGMRLILVISNNDLKGLLATPTTNIII